MNPDIQQIVSMVENHTDRLIDELHDVRRRMYAWQMLAHDLKSALEIQCTVYTPDGFMSIAGRDAINKLEKLQAKELPTP